MNVYGNNEDNKTDKDDIAERIKHRGLLHAITVRKNGEDNYEIIAAMKTTPILCYKSFFFKSKIFFTVGFRDFKKLNLPEKI